jgi:hypothetical protein
MKRSLDFARMNIRVGIMMVIAGILLVWVLFFPTRGVSLVSGKMELKGYYLTADGLKRNSPVFLLGMEVGTVKSVVFTEQGSSYPIEVIIAVEKKVQHLIRKNTVMTLAVKGLLGDVFVELVPKEDYAEIIKPGDIMLTAGLESPLGGLSQMQASLTDTIEHLNRLLVYAQSRETSVGRLFREDRLYAELVSTVEAFGSMARALKDIEETINTKLLDPRTRESVDAAVATAHRVLKRADEVTEKVDQIHWFIQVGINKYEGPLYSGLASLDIVPNKDRFYRGGIEWFNELSTAGPDSEAWDGYLGVNAHLGFRVLESPVFFRGGVKRSSVGAGLDLRVQDIYAKLPLEFSADVSRLSKPTAQFDLGMNIKFLDVFTLSGGIEDALNGPFYRAGLMVTYDDKDLTSILVKAGSGL